MIIPVENLNYKCLADGGVRWFFWQTSSVALDPSPLIFLFLFPMESINSLHLSLNFPFLVGSLWEACSKNNYCITLSTFLIYPTPSFKPLANAVNEDPSSNPLWSTACSSYIGLCCWFCSRLHPQNDFLFIEHSSSHNAPTLEGFGMGIALLVWTLSYLSYHFMIMKHFSFGLNLFFGLKVTQSPNYIFLKVFYLFIHFTFNLLSELMTLLLNQFYDPLLSFELANK